MPSKVLLSVNSKGGFSSQREIRYTPSTFKASRDSSAPNHLLKGRVNSRKEWTGRSVHQVTTLEEAEVEQPLKWYEKSPELWTSVRTKEELENVLRSERNKMIFVDLYAGFCGSCKAAYPALCRVAGNPEFRKNFLFVKGDVSLEGIREFVRDNGIKGIPTVMTFAPGGEHLVNFGASFRKMNSVKANLVVMAANKGSDFFVDPNGYVIPKASINLKD